jgi:LuxR family maltose regulon positive regulatory protein
MLLDANAALAKERRGSQWHPTALLLRGCAFVLLGADEDADAVLGDAALEAAALGCNETRMIATGQRSLISRRRGDDSRSDELSAEARAIAVHGELEEYPTFAVALAASAHTSLRCGRWAETRELLTAADERRPFLTEALPWLAVGVRLEVVRCYLALRDLGAARTLAAEIRAILDLRPDLGVLDDRARELQRDLGALIAIEENARLGLTPAELRLLPLLATHLSFREIAERLAVSRNTVKTQAISIYRKLGVSGRSDAIAAAANLDPTRVAS